MPTAAEPKINEPVLYVSPFRTGVYDAVVRAVHKDGSVTLDIYLPNAVGRRFEAEPAIRLRSVSYGPQGRARPKAGL